MNLKKAKDLSTLELMHASTGFWTEVLSMARRVINVIRSCAFAYLLTIAVLVHGAASAELRSGTLELDPSKTLIEFRLPGTLHTTHGTFKLERGTIIADPATGKAGGSIVVDAKSGDTGIGARDNDMREGVLEAQRYPEITFDPQHFTLKLRSGGQFQATMQGVLTLHGGRHDVDSHGTRSARRRQPDCHSTLFSSVCRLGYERPEYSILNCGEASRHRYRDFGTRRLEWRSGPN